MGTFAEQIPRLVFDGPGMGNMGGLNWRPEGHEDHMLTSHLPEANNGWDIRGCRSGRSIDPESFSREPRPHGGDIGRQKRRQEEPANICCVLNSRDALDWKRKRGVPIHGTQGLDPRNSEDSLFRDRHSDGGPEEVEEIRPRIDKDTVFRRYQLLLPQAQQGQRVVVLPVIRPV